MQKFSKIIDQQDYTRLMEFQLEQISAYHQIMGYEGIEISNYLIKVCNEALANDDITIAHLT